MLSAYLAYFKDHRPGDFEMLVVVNGSTDGTEKVVQKFIDRYPEVRMIVIPDPVGKGGALLRGLREAETSLIGYVDADGATSPEQFQRLLDASDQADVVIASRWLPGSDVPMKQPLSRRFASRLFNATVRLFFGLRLTDTQCGAKLVHREKLKPVLPSLGITSWVFDVDLLYHLKRNRCRILEVPTVWNDVEGSKVQMFGTMGEVLFALLRLRFLYSPLRFLVHWYDNKIGHKAYMRRIMKGYSSHHEPPGQD